MCIRDSIWWSHPKTQISTTNPGSRCTRKRSITETHSSILQCNRNPSDYFLRITLNRVHKLQPSSENLMSPSLSLTSSPLLLLAEPFFFFSQQFNCILWTRTKAQNNTQIFALLTHAPQSSAGWQSGKYYLRLKRGHSPNTPKWMLLRTIVSTKTGVIEATVSMSKHFPNDDVKKLGALKLYVPI